MTTAGALRSTVIVSVRRSGEHVDPDDVQETRQLAEGIGLEVLETRAFTEHAVQRFLLGKGQIQDLRDLLSALRADMVLFDTDLTALQYRYLADALGVPVMDRTRLILETFAAQAQTAEARKRVQIAERMFELTQLRAMNAGYDQQAGYIGMRGPGETLFQERRRARRSEIHELKEQVGKIDTRYAVKARARQLAAVPKMAVVGYTNAGKSTLINVLANAHLAAEDRPFATLDTAVRPVRLGRQSAVLIDTVGFIRNLPASLMDSFRSTLEETRSADLLLHVVDAGVRDLRERIAVVEDVLASIGCSDIPEVIVFNKMDTLPSSRRGELLSMETGFPVSAVTGEGLQQLRDAIADTLLHQVRHGKYVIPFAYPEARAEVYSSAVVLSERTGPHSWIIEAAASGPGAQLPPKFLRRG